MWKRYTVVLVILCLLGLLAQDKYFAFAQETEDMDSDELDNFFDDAGDEADEIFDDSNEIFDEPITEQPDFEDMEREEPEEVVQIPQPQYEPPEPVPVFETETEKYIYYARKYLIEIEICLSSIFIVYILNIFVGKKVNSKIVSMWLAEAKPLLEKNFHQLGFVGEESNLSISQIKYHEYEFYATGRDNCKYMFIHMMR